MRSDGKQNWPLSVVAIAIVLSSVISVADAESLPADPELGIGVLRLAQEWDHAAYKVVDKKTEFAELDYIEADADALAARFPGSPEPFIWKAMTIVTKADRAPDIQALALARRAKKTLEYAQLIAPQPADQSLLEALLGVLYCEVPAFPLGFGDPKKAESHLKKAIALNPNGIDENYYYGMFLVRNARFEEARAVLERARIAPGRPGRALGDAGRRRDIAELSDLASRRVRK